MRKNLPVLPLPVLSVLFTVLFMTACPEPPPPVDTPKGRKFWAVNFATSKYYQVIATKFFDGSKCEIWVENGSKVSTAQAKAIANEYDGKIEDLILEHFGIEDFKFSGSSKTFTDVMEFANYITYSEKFIILLLDIKDGYKKEDGAYVAGYFTGENYFSTKNSNLTNMIYIDTKPGLESPKEMYSTLAHEMQHLASFMAAIVKRSTLNSRGQITSIGWLDTWIDEGMSTMAEYFYRGEQTPRYTWFNDDLAGTIAQGNNFYVWGNYPGNSILDEYATAYMFFQWLYLQSGKDHLLFKEITGAAQSDYRALIEAAQEIQPTKWDNWETLLRDWLVANYINDPDSEYGYKDSEEFSTIIVSTPATTYPHTLNLYPGEGVYSKIPLHGFVPGNLSHPGYIRYAGLQKNPGAIALTPPYTSDALLSFNANTVESGNTETAYLTGEKLPLEASVSHSSLRAVAPPRPLVMDANDIIGRQRTLPKIELRW